MSRFKNKLNTFLFFTFLISTISCSKPAFYEKNTPVDSGIWARELQPKFSFTIVDTLAAYNCFLNLRNSGDYKYSNLWLFVHTTSPSGLAYIDTIECLLADKTGKWYGNSGSGGFWDNRILFRVNTFFKDTGTYSVKIEQAMREEELQGIYDVGLRIENTKH